MEKPGVYLCKVNDNFNLIVLYSEISENCYVFTIDLSSGSIYYRGIPNLDIFPSVKEALDYINKTFTYNKTELIGKYLIGSTIKDNKLIIYTVKEDEVTAVLFNKEIKTIKTCGFSVIPILNKNIASTNLDNPFKDFPINSLHYFSNFIDLSSTFPYNDRSKSDGDFFWNNRFTRMFEDIGVDDAFIRIYQGSALSLSLNHDHNNITYVIRRSSVRGGTRYNSRGIDDTARPANECECELIFKVNNMYYSKAWRRGSPPIFWETSLNYSISKPQHKVTKEYSYRTVEYFKYLKERFDSKIVALSLLSTNEDGGEASINESYEKSVKDLIDVEFKSIDFNEVYSNSSYEEALSFFYNALKDKDDTNFSSMNGKQTTLMRFNCADSLDRTNLMTFYYSILLTSAIASKYGVFKSDNSRCYSLDNDVLTFLGDAFIRSGNIISNIYTNTSAIKTAPILSLMQNATPQYPDSVISLVRRFQNVTFDYSRNLLIQTWTDVTRKVKTFFLDKRYLSIIRTDTLLRSVQEDILDISNKWFYFDKTVSEEVFVRLPEDMLLSKVRIKLFPISSFEMPSLTVKCGPNYKNLYTFVSDVKLPRVEKETIFDLNMRKLAYKSSQIPVDPVSLQAHPFILLKFSCRTSFIIGCIQIGVKIPHDGSIALTRTNDQELDENRSLKILSFRSDNLTDIALLENYCILNNISNPIRNELFIRNMRNPFLYDIQGRLSLIEEGRCSFCLKRDGDFCLFSSKPPYYSIFVQSNGKSSSNSCYLCTNCRKDYMPNKKLLFDEEKIRDTCFIADFNSHKEKYRSSKYQKLINLSLFSIIYDATYEDECKIDELSFLLIENNQKVLEFNDSIDLFISFPHYCNISEIVIVSDSEFDTKFYASLNGNLEPSSYVKSGGSHIFKFKSHIILENALRINFSSNSKFSIKNMIINGCISIEDQEIDRKMTRIPFDGKKNFKAPSKVYAPSIYDIINRIQKFNFGTKRSVSAVQILTNGGVMAQTIVVVLIDDSTVVSSQNLIIPKVESISVLYYEFSDWKFVCSEVDIYYLDRLDTVDIYQFSFI